MSIQQEIVNKVAKETGLSKAQITSVFRSQFELVMNTMEDGFYESVRIPLIGTFHVPEKKLDAVKKRIKATQDGKKETTAENTGTVSGGETSQGREETGGKEGGAEEENFWAGTPFE